MTTPDIPDRSGVADTDTDAAQLSALFALTSILQPLRRLWTQAATQACEYTGLSMPIATVVLLTYRRGEGVSQASLAEETGVNPGAMVRTLDQAEAQGLIERRTAPHDRRSKLIYLQKDGRALAARVESLLVEMRHQLLGDLPLADIQTTVDTLKVFETRVSRYLQERRDAS